MDSFDSLISLIAITMGVGWASGINLYAAVLMLGLMSNLGHIQLPAELQVVADPMVLMAAGFMYCVEFFADKVPGVDTSWDGLHTFVRIPAGAMLAAAAVGDISPAVEIAAGLMGGTLAAGSHALKAGSRVMINTSPEPFSNWVASISEDLVVLGGLWAALYNPALFLVGLVLFVIMLVWLLPKLWRAIKGVARLIIGWFGGRGDNSDRETIRPE